MNEIAERVGDYSKSLMRHHLQTFLQFALLNELSYLNVHNPIKLFMLLALLIFFFFVLFICLFRDNYSCHGGT